MARGPRSTAPESEPNSAAMRASDDAPSAGTALSPQAATTSGPTSPPASAALLTASFTTPILVHSAARALGAHLHRVTRLQLAHALDHDGGREVLLGVHHQQQSDVLVGRLDVARLLAAFALRVRLRDQDVGEPVAVPRDREGVALLHAVGRALV